MSEQNSSNEIIIEMLEEEKEEKINPKDTAPPEGSPRWNEIYGKMKQYERDIEVLKNEKEDMKALMEEMKSFNKKLSASITAQTEAFTEMVKKDPKVSIDEKIQQLKIERKEALENLDYDLAEEINDKIFDLKLEKRDIKPKNIKPPQVDIDAYQAFITNVEWYQKDPEMRMYANELDKEFAMDSVWGKRSVKDRLAEIKKRTEKRFDYNVPKVSGVEGVVGYGKTSKSIKLSQDEMALANAFGLSYEDWAKQKLYIEGRLGK